MPKKPEIIRGSGSDLNSDTDRLRDQENLLDKTDEDSFPASDAPSHSPMTGTGGTRESSRGLPEDFKDNKGAQFEYGRKSQLATQHFDTSDNRLRNGNPDIGEVDMGIIEADRPTALDDNDPFDTPDDPGNVRSNREFDRRLDNNRSRNVESSDSSENAPDPANEY